MFTDEVCRKLENIIQGTVIEEQADHCTAIRNYLCSSFRTTSTVKKDFESKAVSKEEQKGFLEQLATQHNYWVTHLPPGEKYFPPFPYYCTQGG